MGGRQEVAFEQREGASQELWDKYYVLPTVAVLRAHFISSARLDGGPAQIQPIAMAYSIVLQNSLGRAVNQGKTNFPL